MKKKKKTKIIYLLYFAILWILSSVIWYNFDEYNWGFIPFIQTLLFCGIFVVSIAISNIITDLILFFWRYLRKPLKKISYSTLLGVIIVSVSPLIFLSASNYLGKNDRILREQTSKDDRTSRSYGSQLDEEARQRISHRYDHENRADWKHLKKGIVFSEVRGLLGDDLVKTDWVGKNVIWYYPYGGEVRFLMDDENIMRLESWVEPNCKN